MADDKKNFKIARSTFDKQKIDPSSAAFAEEILKKIKISWRQKIFFNLVR